MWPAATWAGAACFDAPVDGDEVFEYAARTIEGELVIRSSKDEDPHYPAARWARDQQALGSRVQRRRIMILDDWEDPPSGV
jgi:hypothetical protein